MASAVCISVNSQSFANVHWECKFKKRVFIVENSVLSISIKNVRNGLLSVNIKSILCQIYFYFSFKKL